MAHKESLKEPDKKLLLEETSSRVSSLYTASQFEPYNPNDLYQERGNYTLYDKMRLDEQVKAVLSLKKYIVLSQGWEIRMSPFGKDLEKETSLLQENLNYWLENSLDNILMQILSALDYGFSISEIIYEIEDGLLWIKDIKTRPPHGFLIHQDDFGNITSLEQQTKGYKSLSLNPTKFIIFIYQEEFQNIYGKSDLESAYRAYWSKDIIMKFWNIYLERNAVPPTIGKYKKTVSQASRERLLELLDNIQNKSSLVLPEDIEISLLEASRSATPDFEKAIDKYNLMIARSLLMPDLLGLAGAQTSGGSYSLGSKQFDLFLLVIKSIQKDLERCINNRLIRPFFKFNFGIEENYPLFRFVEQSEENKNELSKIWLDAVTRGVITASQEEISHFRQTVGFPEPKIEQEKEELDDTEEKSENFSLNFDIKKPRTYSEKKYYKYILKTFTTLNSKEIEWQKELRPVISKIIESIIEQKYKKNIDIKYKKELQNTLIVMFKDIYESSTSQAEEMLSEEKKVKLTLDYAIPRKNVDAFKKQAFKITGDISQDMLKKAQKTLKKSLNEGLSEAETVQELSRILDQFKEARLKVIVRTNLNNAWNEASLTQYRDPDLEGFVQGVEFSAILDESTTAICESLDGKQFKLDDPYVDQIRPPLFFSCRSQLLPITLQENFNESKKVEIKPIDKEDPNGFQEIIKERE